MRTHFGPRATVGRAVEDLVHGLRRLPRLIDNLHLVAERERRKAEQEEAVPAPVPSRLWPRLGFAEIVAALALAAAIVAWWH
jgi:ubiquinone biosynthesis protein